jgi:hypothetical protein
MFTGVAEPLPHVFSFSLPSHQGDDSEAGPVPCDASRVAGEQCEAGRCTSDGDHYIGSSPV